MRAPGEAPGSFALEAALDELAEKCGIDPIELRLRNEPETGPVSGLPFAGRNLAACFREGARRFGWADRDSRPGVRREGRWLLGTGTAAASFPAGAAPSTATATAHPTAPSPSGSPRPTSAPGPVPRSPWSPPTRSRCPRSGSGCASATATSARP